MATSTQITEVRLNTKILSTDEPYTDQVIGDLIDAYGVNGASSKLWTAKAASVANLVDISEGGSSRKMSELHKTYLSFADRFAADGDGDGIPDGVPAPRTRRAVRV